MLGSEMPFHTHTVSSSSGAATTANPAAATPAAGELELFHSSGDTSGQLSVAGSAAPHNNMQPYLTLYYAIALQGVYPPRG